ncbi:MAG: DUF2066 domain-containing protein [Granulosicoccaceae bacterium]
MQNRWLSLSNLSPQSVAFRLLAAACLMISGNNAIAQSSYQVEVAVADKGAAEQKQAYQVALRRVLLTNSPDKTLLNRDDVRAGINEAELYVQSFSYRSPEPGTVISRATPVTDLVRRTGEATQLVMIAFDPARIQELISTKKPENDEDDPAPSGLANVRSALAWILVQDGRSDLLVGGSVGASVMQRSLEIAGGNGIRLMFPTADQTDIDALTGDQIRAKDTAATKAAASRYSSPVVITAYLARKRSRGWIGLWSKVAGEEAEHQEFESETLDDMMALGISWLSSTSAGGQNEYQYGGDAAAHTEGLVWVNSVGETAAYAKVMAYLDSVETVVSVYPKEIGPNGTLFAVMPRTALNAIAANATSLAWLRRTSPPADGSLSAQAELAFDFLQ